MERSRHEGAERSGSKRVADCLALAEEELREHYGPKGAVLMARLEEGQGDLHAALHWLWERGEAEQGLKLLNASYWYWAEGAAQEGLHLLEGRGWFARFLALPQAQSRTTTRALALEHAAMLTVNQYRYATGQAGSPSWASSDPADPDLLHAAARAYFDESLSIKQEQNDDLGVALLLIHIGHMEGTWDRPAAAEVCYQESLAIYRKLGRRDSIALSGSILAGLFLDRGEPAKAAPLVRESLELSVEMARQNALPGLLELAAGVAAGTGTADVAWRLYGAAAAHREAVGQPLHPTIEAQLLRWLQPALTTLDESIRAALWEEGRSMTIETAIDTVLNDRPWIRDAEKEIPPNRTPTHT